MCALPSPAIRRRVFGPQVYRKQGLATSLINFMKGIAEAHGIGLYASCDEVSVDTNTGPFSPFSPFFLNCDVYRRCYFLFYFIFSNDACAPTMNNASTAKLITAWASRDRLSPFGAQI